MADRNTILWQFDYYFQKLRNADIIDRRRLYALWEQGQLRRLFDYLNVDCVFDVGANAGQYAKMLRRNIGYNGLIISFEPIPEMAAILRREAEKDHNWIVHELAIADTDGRRTFNIMQASEFSSLGNPMTSGVKGVDNGNAMTKSIDVQTQMLATAFNEAKLRHKFDRPFLKLDTQGFDVAIARSSRAMIHEFLGFQSEMAIVKLYDSSIDFRHALTEYERLGFTLSALVPNNEGHFPRLLEVDCIMIRTDLISSVQAAHTR